MASRAVEFQQAQMARRGVNEDIRRLAGQLAAADLHLHDVDAGSKGVEKGGFFLRVASWQGQSFQARLQALHKAVFGRTLWASADRRWGAADDLRPDAQFLKRADDADMGLAARRAATKGEGDDGFAAAVHGRGRTRTPSRMRSSG